LNDLIEKAKAHIRAKKTRLRGMIKKRFKANALAALSSLIHGAS
jgi:hypothetical protein